MEINKAYRYCGRDFTIDEMEIIRRITEMELSRNRMSQEVCRQLQWFKPDGKLKEMSCRVAMLQMEKDALISLPPPKNKNNNGKPYPPVTSLSNPLPPIHKPADELKKIHLRLVTTREQSKLWNEYIERYHYLGYKPLPGAQLRYFVECEEGFLACLGFAASAWKVAPRDQWIGWTGQQREKNLHLIVNNARFLILPWVRSGNLASKILSMVSKQISSDWKKRYNYQPVLLETFVQKDRFEGTCYKAANWILLGKTKGRGKLDRDRLQTLPIKYIFVYPLHQQFITILLS
ncbi:DUF4338 domain-containing protein [bacterium]|nr:DUF4338 domain-containing protein [bacterium]